MARMTKKWLEAVAKPRGTAWRDGKGGAPLSPVLPFVAHEVHPDLVHMVSGLGTVRKLAKGDEVFTEGDSPALFAYVTKGIVARGAGRSGTVSSLVLPGRLASGDLGLFTGLPSYAHAYALVPSEEVIIPKETISHFIANDRWLSLLAARQMELAAASDRVSAAVRTSLPPEGRLAAFFYTWAACYGEEEAGRIAMPAPLPRRIISELTATPETQIDRLLKEWGDAGYLVQEGDRVTADFLLLLPIQQWMVEMEKRSSVGRFRGLRGSLFGSCED